MRCTLPFILAVMPAVALGQPLAASPSDTAVGVELARVDDSVSILGVDSSTDGVLAGFHASVARSAAFRGDLRVLAGSLDLEANGGEASTDATLAEIRGTWGMTTRSDDRLYSGVGVDRTSADSSAGPGASTTWLLYVPVGITSYADWYNHWRVAVTVEGQLLLASQTEIEDIPNTGDETFTSTGGAGPRVSVDFEPDEAPLRISPYLEATVLSDSSTERVHGVPVELEDQETSELGVRMMWRF